METMGSGLLFKTQALRKVFREPREQVQSHPPPQASSICKVPDGPSLVLTPGPAAAQQQLHLLSGLPPASHPQPGQQEDPDTPTTTEEGLPFLLPAGQE